MGPSPRCPPPLSLLTTGQLDAGYQGFRKGGGGGVVALFILRKADLHLHTDPFSTVSVGAQSLRVCETGENEVSWYLPHLESWSANGCLEPQGTSAQ